MGYGPPWTERDVLDAAWAILKDRKAMTADHGQAVGWASAYVDTQRTPGVVVVLDESEVAEVMAHAEATIANADARGMTMKFAPPHRETRLDVSARGYGAELAAAKATGLVWHKELLGPGYRRSHKRADLGQRVEVRNVQHPNGRLWAYPNDPIDRLFLLVVGRLPRFRIAGWLEGRELQDERFRDDSGRAGRWSAEQVELHPLPLPSDA